jgi:uncharacterized protein with GYD domain
MPKYLFRSRHTPEGVKGLIKDGGTSRRAESERFVASVGGKIECFYYAFGASDVFIIADLPDNASAASVNLTVAASGAIDSETIVLLTPEEIDEATKKSPAYRPPGAS